MNTCSSVQKVYHVFGNSTNSKLCAPHIVSQLQAILADPKHLVNLKLELAVTIVVGEHFVKATYDLLVVEVNNR